MSTHEPVVTQQILDLIASKSDEQRASRRMSKDVVDALKECGFFTMLLPKQWGGLERKPQEFFAEQVRIAEADMSTAWAGGIIAVHAFQLALMSEEAQRGCTKMTPIRSSAARITRLVPAQRCVKADLCFTDAGAGVRALTTALGRC